MSISERIKRHQSATNDALSFVELYNSLGWLAESRAKLHEADAHRRAAKQLISSFDAFLQEVKDE